MTHFEQFNYKDRKHFRKPAVTIVSNGAINFNTGVIHKYIQGKNYVILHYDKKDKRIGFEFLSKNFKEAFKIRKPNVWVIPGRPFLNYYEIFHKKTNRYHAYFDSVVNLVIIDLKNPVNK